MIEISVIIPTRNRCFFLQKALESLTKQTFSMERFEVIVIDNGSTDDTKAITESFDGKFKLQYHYDDRPGLHVGRHDGIKLSKSNLLAFADDDIEAFPTWLEGIYESFQDKKVVLVGGKNLPLYENQPPFWIQQKWYQLCEFGHCICDLSILDFGDEVRNISPYYIWGCNFSIRKDVLLDAGGFHPDGMPFELIRYRGDGETYVSQYVIEHNLIALYNPKASIYHLVPKERLSIDYFCKRAFCQGVSDSYTHLRNHTEKEIDYTPSSKWRKRIRTVLGIEGVGILKRIESQLNLTDYDKQIKQSYEIGYSYHQSQYKRDISIREWVHKENYIE